VFDLKFQFSDFHLTYQFSYSTDMEVETDMGSRYEGTSGSDVKWIGGGSCGS